jgi:hypothetical protein
MMGTDVVLGGKRLSKPVVKKGDSEVVAEWPNGFTETRILGDGSTTLTGHRHEVRPA